MRLKGFLNADSSGSTNSVTGSTTSSPKTSKNARHMSLHHEKMSAKKMKVKQLEIEKAVKYCRDNNCKGYKAITDLGLQYVKDARTINQHLQGNVITGDEKKYQKILTDKE
jgi:hypothetical protein